MKPIVLSTGHPNADTVGAAFAKGIGTELIPVAEYTKQNISRHSGRFSVKDPDDLPIFFGILRGTGTIARNLMSTAANARKNSFIYIDHGYLNPGHFSGHYRCIWNGLHARPIWKGDPGRLKVVMPSLVKKTAEIKKGPKHASGHVVVAVPSAHVANFWGFDLEDWVRMVTAALKQNTDRTILFTEKGGDVSGEGALNGAHALVTAQSNLAITALAMGVNVFIVPPVVQKYWVDWWHPAEQLCYLGLKSIEVVGIPEPEQVMRLLEQLAACQFTLDEMEEGVAWKWLMENTCWRPEKELIDAD